MDDGKPSISPHDLHSRSASERTSAAVDPPPAALVASNERVVPERPSVAVYYRNEEEIRRGFLVALSAMGLAQVEEPPEPAMRPVRGATP
jgi:hypothetical protein